MAKSACRESSGINFIDTADVYSARGSEEIVSKAIAGRRDNIVAIAAPVGVLAHRPMHLRGEGR